MAQLQKLSKLKIFFIAYGIILCVVYLFNRTYLGYSMSLVMPFHMVLIFFTGGLTYFFQGHFKWENDIFKYTYNTFACYCQTTVLLSFVYWLHDIYLPVMSEIIYLIVWVVVGFAGAFVISLPFKLLQAVLYGTKVYGNYEEDVADWED